MRKEETRTKSYAETTEKSPNIEEKETHLELPVSSNKQREATMLTAKYQPNQNLQRKRQST
jgi:hypothetical protein